LTDAQESSLSPNQRAFGLERLFGLNRIRRFENTLNPMRGNAGDYKGDDLTKSLFFAGEYPLNVVLATVKFPKWYAYISVTQISISRPQI